MDCDELESMLDADLPDDLRNKKKEYEERFKTVLEGNWGQISANNRLNHFLLISREGKKSF
jgi:hypothetical protein